jgi:Arylsulfatase A and related enzymes
MSDNGPPFINSKTTLYDTGVHLPFLIRVPGRIPGNANPNMISWVDVLPAFLDWAGHAGRQPGPGFWDPRRGRSFLSIVDHAEADEAWSCVFGSHTFHEVTNYWPTRYMRGRRYKYHRNVCWRLEFPFAMDLSRGYATIVMPRQANP